MYNPLLVLMPSRFVDLGSATEDAATIASELAVDAAHAVGDAVGGRVRVVQDWAANVNLTDALPANMSASAREAIESATKAFTDATSHLSHREFRTLLECSCLLCCACIVLLVRYLLLRRRANHVVTSHMKLD